MGSRPRVKRPCYGLSTQEYTQPLDSPTFNPYGIRFGSADHRNRYQKLAQRQILRTKFAHIDTLNKLGLTDGVRFLFRNVGWESLLHMNAEVYPRLTLEFLSSLHMLNSGLITFRLLDQDRQLSLAILNTMFEWPVDGTVGPVDSFPQEFNQTGFWHSITCLHDYDPCYAEACQIRHPCLRIAHLIVAGTIFARSDPGTVMPVELFILWAMVQKRSMVKLNTADWLVYQLMRVRDCSSDEICVGGLITLLATRRPLSLCIPPDMVRYAGETSLDIDTLERKHFIRRDSGRFTWLLGPCHTDFATLPNSCRTRVHRYTDWMFPNPAVEVVPDGDVDVLRRIEALETQMTEVRTKLSEMGGMLEPNCLKPVGEAVHDENDSILRRIEALEREMSDVRGEVPGMRSMIAEMHYWSRATYNYHVDQGHFPPP